MATIGCRTAVWLLVIALVGFVSADDVLANPFLNSEVTHLATGESIKSALASVHPSFLEVKATRAEKPTAPSAFSMRFQQIREEVLARSKAEIEAAAEAEFKAEMERIREEARSTAIRRGGVAPRASAPAPAAAQTTAAPVSLAETSASAKLNSNVFNRARGAIKAAAAPAPAPVAATAAPAPVQQKFRFQAFPPSAAAAPSSFLDTASTSAATTTTSASLTAAAKAAAEHDAFLRELAAAEDAVSATRARSSPSSLLETDAAAEAESESEAEVESSDALEAQLSTASEDEFFSAWNEASAADTAQDAIDAADEAFGGSLIETGATATPAKLPPATPAVRPSGYGLLEVASSAAAAGALRAGAGAAQQQQQERRPMVTSSRRQPRRAAPKKPSFYTSASTAGVTAEVPPLPYQAPPAARAALAAAAAERRRAAKLQRSLRMPPAAGAREFAAAVKRSVPKLAPLALDAVTAGREALNAVSVAEAAAAAVEEADETSFIQLPDLPNDGESAGKYADIDGKPSPGWPYANPMAIRRVSYEVANKVRYGNDFAGSRGYEINIRPGSLEDRATGPLGGGLPRESLFEAAEGTAPESDSVVNPSSAIQQPTHFTINGVNLSVGSREPITVPIFPAVPPLPLAPVDMPAEADTIAAAGTPEQYLSQAQPPASVADAAAILGRLPFSGAGGLGPLSPTGAIGPARLQNAPYYPMGGTAAQQDYARNVGISGAAIPTPMGMPGVAALAALGGGPGAPGAAGMGLPGAQGSLAPQAGNLPNWISGGYGGGPAGGSPYGAQTYNDPVRTPLAALLSGRGPIGTAAEVWSGVQMDSTLKEVQYPADTPFMPTDSIGPQVIDGVTPPIERSWPLPPAPMDQPVAAMPDFGHMAGMGLPMGGVLG